MIGNYGLERETLKKNSELSIVVLDKLRGSITPMSLDE
jgi:hypothetical protein